MIISITINRLQVLQEAVAWTIVTTVGCHSTIDSHSVTVDLYNELLTTSKVGLLVFVGH